MGERTVKDAMLNVPVDQAYAQGINEMGEGPSVSAYEWVNALAHMLSSGLGMRGGIGAPGGAPRTTPHPKDMDLRKLVNDYARFVMGKAPAPLKEPDPAILRQLQNPGQITPPGSLRGLQLERLASRFVTPGNYEVPPQTPEIQSGVPGSIRMPWTTSGYPLMDIR